MSIPLFLADAFTATKFAGNPAAVCLLTSPRDANWMQQVAAEMNLSETAFLVTRDGGWDLRWFTPTAEVDLCGHATLASAHVLFEIGAAAPVETLSFHTRSGWLTARTVDGCIELDFPTTPVELTDLPDGLARVMGLRPVSTGQTPFDYFIEVEDEPAVRDLKPDLMALRSFPARGVIVTSRAATPGVDFVSRFFGPAVGIDEDPVTGSAHCALAPYWAPKFGKSVMLARQLSQRGGEVQVDLRGDRVLLSGRAVTTLRGELLD